MAEGSDCEWDDWDLDCEGDQWFGDGLDHPLGPSAHDYDDDYDYDSDEPDSYGDQVIFL